MYKKVYPKFFLFISGVIMFLSTAVIPNLIISILQVNWDVAILAAFVSTFFLLLLILIRHLLQRIAQLKAQQEDFSGQYEEVLIYSINGRAWADIFQRNTCRVIKCTLFVRKYIEGFGEKSRYETERTEAIEIWKDLLNEGRIAQLYIYEYDHISDHFYAVFDESLVVTGLNSFVSSDSTGQYGDRHPYQIHADSPEKTALIKKYKNNFKNLQEHYNEHQIYNSRNRHGG